MCILHVVLTSTFYFNTGVYGMQVNHLAILAFLYFRLSTCFTWAADRDNFDDVARIPLPLSKSRPNITLHKSHKKKSSLVNTGGDSSEVDPCPKLPSFEELLTRCNHSSISRNCSSTADYVISYSLYGSNARYTHNLLRNIGLRDVHFKGWTIRIYHSNRHQYIVPSQVLNRLSENAGVQLVDVTDRSLAPMLWRYLPVDEPPSKVKYFLSRDADSLLTSRDACAVRAWLHNGAPFNCIRDHPSHARYAVSGGLWGVNVRDLRAVLAANGHRNLQYWMANERVGKAYMQDMDFLNTYIWPIVQSEHAYCSDSVSCDRYPSSHPFPVTRGSNWGHVGQVYDGSGQPRALDIELLKQHLPNVKCIPT